MADKYQPDSFLLKESVCLQKLVAFIFLLDAERSGHYLGVVFFSSFQGLLSFSFEEAVFLWPWELILMIS